MPEKNNKTREHSIKVHMDTLPNVLKIPGQEEQAKGIFRQRMEENLDDMIDRYKKLPAIIVHLGKYSELLFEARELYIEGKFYSCVAMCGVTTEKIAKELLKIIILFRQVDKGLPPTEKQSIQLDRIQMDIIRELLIQSEVVDKPLRNSFMELSKLRDKYIHATGKNPEKDAQKAISYLHEIIEGTVSVFKHYEIQKGKLVLKNKP